MRRTFVYILTLLVVAGALVWWQNRASQNGRISPPAGLMFSLLRPGQKAVSSVGGWFGDVGKAMFRRGDIISENEELRGRVADLEGQNLRLQRYLRENEELKSLLKTPKPPGGKSVAAQIVSFDTSEYTQRFFINVGHRQGVQKKDIVYTAHGVVGQIVNSDYKLLPLPTSEVLLLTDRSASIGAVIARSGATGVVKGTGGELCKLEYLDFYADVREGDTVLSSGMVVKVGGVFPKGLVIGRVVKIERDKTLSRLSAYVEPAVPFKSITTVWVRAGAHS